MKKGATTTFRLDPKDPPKADWSAFDAMSDADRHAAALSDPDAHPARAEQLSQAKRRIDVRSVRKALNLSQEQFAERFGLPLGTIRDWEQGAHIPDRAAQVLLRVIAREPDAVDRALANSI